MFQTPQSMLDKDRFSKFVVTLTKVLDAFASQPLRDGRSGSGLTPLDEDQSYAVKYLTSSKLLHLQMRDPAFRRHFLLQCIILMQYCRMPPKPVRARSPPPCERAWAAEHPPEGATANRPKLACRRVSGF